MTAKPKKKQITNQNILNIQFSLINFIFSFGSFNLPISQSFQILLCSYVLYNHQFSISHSISIIIQEEKTRDPGRRREDGERKRPGGRQDVAGVYEAWPLSSPFSRSRRPPPSRMLNHVEISLLVSCTYSLSSVPSAVSPSAFLLILVSLDFSLQLYHSQKELYYFKILNCLAWLGLIYRFNPYFYGLGFKAFWS